MRSFVTNIASLLVGNLFSLAINFVFSIVMLQKLSQAEYGLQSAIAAFASIVMGVADFGLFDVASRELARRRGDDQRNSYNSFFTLELCLAGVIYSVALIVALLLNSFPGPLFIIFVLGLFTLALSYVPIIPTEALMAARGRVRQIALIQSFYAFFTAVLGIIILLQGGGLLPIYIALSLLSVITILLYLWEVWQLFPGGVRFVIRFDEWKYFLSQSFPVGLGAAFQMSCLRLGTFLVYTFTSKEAAGYMGVSFLLISGVTSIVWVPYAINIMPIMVRLYTHSNEQLMWLASRSITLLLAVTLPVCVGTTLIAPELLYVLSPTQLGASATLRIFIWVLPGVIVASFLYRLLLVMARQRAYMIIAGLAGGISAICCLLLIPQYGAEGAAFGAVVGVSLIAIFCVWIVRDWLFTNFRILDGLRLAVALLSMSLVVEGIGNASVFVRIGLGGGAYLIVLLGSGLFPSADRSAIRALLAVTHP
ncbi:MAG: oligosaccharide flippase family protein [Aggregatilineales bacterium]